jgi:hypothetical protein
LQRMQDSVTMWGMAVRAAWALSGARKAIRLTVILAWSNVGLQAQ